MPPNTHAILSASSSHRWLNCNPSARLEQEFADRETDAAAEGTAAHALCEHKLRRALKMRSKKPISPYDCDEMDACTDAYGVRRARGTGARVSGHAAPGRLGQHGHVRAPELPERHRVRRTAAHGDGQAHLRVQYGDLVRVLRQGARQSPPRRQQRTDEHPLPARLEARRQQGAYQDVDSLIYWANQAAYRWGLRGMCMWSLGQEDMRLWEWLPKQTE